MGRGIPWLEVVRFHKDILTSAEDSFFSYPCRDRDSDRWAELVGWQPPNLSGPWEAPARILSSRRFRPERQDALYIAGPCYLAFRRKEGSTWICDWRPILYRKVSARRREDGRFDLVPEQGKWRLSPLLSKLAEKSETSAPWKEDEGDFVSKLLEETAARGRTSARSADALRRAMVAACPGLERDLNSTARRDIYPRSRCNWILFAESDRFSSMNRHLMADYEVLESRLAEDPQAVGGLSILDDATGSVTHQEGAILPHVPLNERQRQAVASMLGEKPLTVVSGPPGCGKSQIVVSTLLNAWARGTSVLFGSNNNQAVDVVLQRLERVEAEAPLAVRAGNRARSRIQETLRRILNLGSSRASATERELRRLQMQRENLVEERGRMTQLLRSNVPQRLEEGVQAASEAWGYYLESRAAVERSTAEWDARWRQGGLEGLTHDEVARRLPATRAWVKAIPGSQKAEERDEQERAKARRELRRAQRDRDESAAGAGVSVRRTVDWTWLSADPESERLQAWARQVENLRSVRVGEALKPYEWIEAFARWHGSDEARDASRKASALARDVPSRLARFSRPIERIESARRGLHEAERRLARLGFATGRDSPPPEDIVAAWSLAHTEYIGLPSGWLARLPMSRRSQLSRTLRQREADLRPHLPPLVWKTIGVLDDEGRGRLAKVVSALGDWRAACDDWRGRSADREAVDRGFDPLRDTSRQLGVGDIPPASELRGWTPDRLVSGAAELSELARRASVAWRRRSDRDKAVVAIEEVASAWRRLRNNPLLRGWMFSDGRSCVKALTDLADQPTPARWERFREVFGGAWARSLQESWSDLAARHRAVLGREERLEALPPRNSRLRDWWKARPSATLPTSATPSGNTWPDVGRLRRESSAMAKLARERAEWERTELASLVGKRDRESERVVRQLRGSLAAVDEMASITSGSANEIQGLRAELHAAITGFGASPSSESHLDDVQRHLKALTPPHMKSRIGKIDSRLEHLALATSKADWLRRLQTNGDGFRALDAVHKAMRRHWDDLPSVMVGSFREALPLMPTWVVTAQATQAIPMEPGLFDLVVIDEASQCTLTNLLPLLYRARRLAIIGDKEQLPAIPSIQTPQEEDLARKHGIEGFLDQIGHSQVTAYDAAVSSLPRRQADVVDLTAHYRSHAQIIAFANRYIYECRLKIRDRQGDDAGAGVVPVSVSGRATRRRSWMNEAEAKAVVEWVRQYREVKDQAYHSLGVVTPFRGQKERIEYWLGKADLDEEGEIQVGTAHAFQGDERDVMVFSPVVAQGMSQGAIRWVEEPPNLINVAWTRARRTLAVVCDTDFLARQRPNGMLRHVADYCRDIRRMRETGSREEELLFNWMLLQGWHSQVHPVIGDIEVDFALRESGIRLAIEVDGDQHRRTEQEDIGRDQFLRARGWLVLRIPARDVRETPHEVIHLIRQRLAL